MTPKRRRVEEAVNNHPQFCKVSDYLAEKHNLDKAETKRKFIDFLVKENFQYINRNPIHVRCFEFNALNGEFINRTKKIVN